MKRSICILFALVMALVFLPVVAPAYDYGASPPTLSRDNQGSLDQESIGVRTFCFVNQKEAPLCFAGWPVMIYPMVPNLHSSRIKILGPSPRYTSGPPPTIVRKWLIA